MRVLIADDDRGVREGMLTRIADAGYTAMAVGGGREAIKAFYAFKPDLIILDARMPDVSGFDVCYHIRNEPEGRNLPVIFVSGASGPTPQYVERCADATGADHFLTKPYDGPSLIALLDSIRAATR